MTDLNEWRLAVADPDALTDGDAAAGRAIDLGTHESGYPFTTQVKVGETVVETADMPHPQSDGWVPGVDRARGAVVSMAGVALGESRPRRRPWADRMDEAGALAAVWGHRGVRSTPGRVAGLVNLDRGRMVYGRPRGFVSDLEAARYGWVPWSVQFTATHPGWFGADEHAATVTIGAGTGGGFVFPLTFPAATTAASESPRGLVSNTGDTETWGRYELTGPILEPRVELLGPDGAVVWSHRYVGAALAADETLTVDMRPWARAVRLGGGYVSGRLRGDALADSWVPVGVSEVRLRGVDPTGTARLTFRYRTGHAHL